MTKKVTKRNPQDATLRNIRALKKEIKYIKADIFKIYNLLERITGTRRGFPK